MSPQVAGMLEDITAVIRHGGALPSDHGALEPEHPMWVEFARSMAPMMQMPAELIAEMFAVCDSKLHIKVLDISAGHGVYGIAFAKHNPSAQVIGLDWANVLEVAKENAGKAGVADRYSTIAGSAFDVDLGSGYDIVLIPNFLHHFDPATNEKLLRKVHAALAPGGIVVTPDFIPNEDRVSPAARRDVQHANAGHARRRRLHLFRARKDVPQRRIRPQRDARACAFPATPGGFLQIA